MDRAFIAKAFHEEQICSVPVYSRGLHHSKVQAREESIKNV